MTKKQERIITVSKWRYPNEGDLDKQLAFIDGAKFVKSENFCLGLVIGILIFTVLLIFAMLLASTSEYSHSDANALLNSTEWKIDTMKTITNGRDTSTTYKFVPNGPEHDSD